MLGVYSTVDCLPASSDQVEVGVGDAAAGRGVGVPTTAGGFAFAVAWGERATVGEAAVGRTVDDADVAGTLVRVAVRTALGSTVRVGRGGGVPRVGVGAAAPAGGVGLLVEDDAPAGRVAVRTGVCVRVAMTVPPGGGVAVGDPKGVAEPPGVLVVAAEGPGVVEPVAVGVPAVVTVADALGETTAVRLASAPLAGCRVSPPQVAGDQNPTPRSRALASASRYRACRSYGSPGVNSCA